jgi:hypothetical protein
VHLQKSTVVVGFIWAAFTGAANAASLTTSGIWIDADPSDTVGLTGIKTNEIFWGSPASSSGQSGYSFVSMGSATVDPSDLVAAPFAIGTFTHNNFPIFSLPDPSSITGATLDVDLSLDAFSTTFTFDFAHFETPNSVNPCAAGGSQPCPDEVSFLDGGVSSQFITLEGIDYNLTLIGFSQDGGTTLVDKFLTLEGQANSAVLYAQLTEVPPPAATPEPASLLGLIAIGGIATALKCKHTLA